MTQKHSLTIQAVSIIGGILTAIFFLGFLALARILRSDISYLIVGSILILTTLTISRMVIRSFLDAMNITLYIAGCVLIGFGINASINILFTTLMGISILTFLLSRGFIQTISFRIIHIRYRLTGRIINQLSDIRNK